MKSSLWKLRGLKLHKSDSRDKPDPMPAARLDELAEAAKDLDEMKNCFDSLVSAAAATANSAYEFSESLHDMGTCLLEYTSLHNEANNGILLMLGKLQLELQKILDSYRGHVILTIANPSESLLNELRIVEDMKQHCDEKRNMYDHMVTKLRGGRSKSEKDGGCTLQQLQEAHTEFDKEANLFLFRLKSLKQGQSHCLLAQATRHHAAQLNFFRKGLKSLETVESHVKLVSEEQHIDYYFNELDDNVEDSEDVRDSGNYSNGCTESIELEDDDDYSSCEPSTTGNSEAVKPQETQQTQIQASLEANGTKHRAGGSHSAPLATERTKAMLQRQSLPRKSDTHVLPTPNEAGSVSHSRTRAASHTRTADLTIHTHNPWHSTPMEQKHKNPSSFQLPVPDAAPLSHPDQQHSAADLKKTKRQSFSDPVISKPWSTSTRPGASATGPLPKPSSSSSPPPSPPLMMSSPIISELHELPRPPESSQAKPDRSSSSAYFGHSAPLFRTSDFSGTMKHPPPVAANKAAPLPAPPLAVCRSFSIPSTNHRTVTARSYKLSDSSSQFLLRKDQSVVISPPLQPLSFF